MGKADVDRRTLLASMSTTAAAMLLGSAGHRAMAQSNIMLNYTAWSAAVDQTMAHIEAFEEASGIGVAYENFPGAQFRSSLVTKFVSGEDMDLIWMNDAWTPEFADAGWIVPIDDQPQLMGYNDDLKAYCIDAMTYDGRQYGMVYYTDHMAFFYNRDMLAEAGFDAPPTTWAELVEQAKTIKEKGLSDYPLMVPLTADAWLIEVLGAFVYSFGGTYTGPDGASTLRAPENGTLAAAQFLTDAIHEHGIVSAGAVTTQEIDVLKAFGAGSGAFAILPSYRIRVLNDPAQSSAAGPFRMALMPAGTGEGAGNKTCGWVRYYGLTPRARSTPEREEAVMKLMEWFGGKVEDTYVFQKALILDLGVPFCTNSLMLDPDVAAFYEEWAGGSDVVLAQRELAVKKDVISPWFGEWNDVNNRSWQSIFLQQVTPAEGLAASGDAWDDLKAQYG